MQPTGNPVCNTQHTARTAPRVSPPRAASAPHGRGFIYHPAPARTCNSQHSRFTPHITPLACKQGQQHAALIWTAECSAANPGRQAGRPATLVMVLHGTQHYCTPAHTAHPPTHMCGTERAHGIVQQAWLQQHNTCPGRKGQPCIRGAGPHPATKNTTSPCCTGDSTCNCRAACEGAVAQPFSTKKGTGDAAVQTH